MHFTGRDGWIDEVQRALGERGRLPRMIRVSVFYPKTEGASFDHDYYREKHVPLCVKTWGLAGRRDRQGPRRPERGRGALQVRLDGGARRRDELPGMADIMGDVANYTTIQPVLQTSEIVE